MDVIARTKDLHKVNAVERAARVTDDMRVRLDRVYGWAGHAPAPATDANATGRDGISAALVAMKLAAALPSVAKEYDFAEAIVETEAAWLVVRDKPVAQQNHLRGAI